MWSNAAGTLFGSEFGYEESRPVVFGAPFDSTASFRPGARFGPRAVRGDSYGLESYSPYQDKDLSDCAFFDAGDLELSIGDTSSALSDVEARTRAILTDHKLPILLGGEHLVTLGAVRAVREFYPELRVIHFDAHADLRDEYLGVKLSHASVLRRCWDLLGDGRIHQFGIRSGERGEFLWAAREHVSMRRFDFSGLDGTLTALKGRPVYLTVDMDVLDSSVFPGTGTPEPGGVSFLQLLEAMLAVCAGANVVAADLVELCPPCDQSGASTAVACKLLRELLLGLSY